MQQEQPRQARPCRTGASASAPQWKSGRHTIERGAEVRGMKVPVLALSFHLQRRPGPKDAGRQRQRQRRTRTLGPSIKYTVQACLMSLDRVKYVSARVLRCLVPWVYGPRSHTHGMPYYY